nr:EOG090X069C [Ilyocryptus agilis]
MKLPMSGRRSTTPQVADYSSLSERIKKTLYYGCETDLCSFSLTGVVVETFARQDTLFLEKLRFDHAACLSEDAKVSPCTFVLALIYLERLCKKNPNFVSSLPSSKLFIISVMVASKFLHDEGEEEANWTECAKMEVGQLNKLEKDFLQAIDWELYVDEEDFARALSAIERRVAWREGLKRDWLTYTDLDVLTTSQLLTDTLHLIHDLVVNVTIACMTAYLASLVTLLGSRRTTIQVFLSSRIRVPSYQMSKKIP